MKLKSFKQILLEKSEKHITATWSSVNLDNGISLLTNMKLVSENKIQISLPNSDETKTIIIKNNVIKTIENFCDIKLDLKDENLISFLELYPYKR